VSVLSGGAFKPTVVAAYERGDRSISLQRFCHLARLYGVEPHRLLADALRAAKAKPRVAVHLDRIFRVGGREAEVVGDFVEQVRRLRGADQAEVIELRAGDVEVLATAAGQRSDELLRALAPALGAEPPPE
jgi:transcriptional regulator with XRE-family HTH domain